MDVAEKSLYTLIPIEKCKAVLGLDDRDDTLSGYCLLTATYTIEQYCKRRFLRKQFIERIGFYGDLIIPLAEYPVTEILGVHTVCQNHHNVEIIEPDYYESVPDCGADVDIPLSISLSSALKLYNNLLAIKVAYYAGYTADSVPPDLECACLELAAWNMSRYKGRRVGLTGTVRGNGRDGEHFEMSMPENVRLLLEPYCRKTI